MINAPPYAAAAARNSLPILGVLEIELAGFSSVLEIGTGTAQHAVCFASAMPSLTWQTSDLKENLDAIGQQLDASGAENVLPPLHIDMRQPPAVDERYDAVYSSNTMHIMSWQAVENMLPFVGSVLRDGGVFCYYGPFRRVGDFTTPSNAAFDASLRSKNGQMGLRDLEDVRTLAESACLASERTYAMPANNLLLTFRKAAILGAEPQ